MLLLAEMSLTINGTTYRDRYEGFRKRVAVGKAYTGVYNTCRGITCCLDFVMGMGVVRSTEPIPVLHNVVRSVKPRWCDRN